VNRKDPKFIGRTGRWLISAGIPVLISTLIFASVMQDKRFARLVGERALPYFLFFTPAAIVIGWKIFYDNLEKKWVIPWGVAAWVIEIVFACWYFWFGPGALKL
jgi:hypothetical protein